ncbi:MAG: ATP-binding protein [Burkholderiaceae bacterium]
MTDDRLRAEVDELRLRLAEAQDALRAIGSGGVDAFVVRDGGAERVYTLEGAERPYRMWVEKMLQGAATLERGGLLTYCNQRFAEMVGRASDALLGTALRLYVTPDAVDEFDALLRRATRDGGAQAETQLRRANGGAVPVLLTVSVIDNALGVLATDLTAQRHHEHLKLALQDRERLEGELRRSVADLQLADQRKSEFLAMLAHELRNPLAPISNALQILQVDGTGADATRATLAMMERQLRQLVRLIDDLLDVSRIGTGKLELRKNPVELGSIIEQAIETVRPGCAALQQQLTVSQPSQPVILHADAARLAQALGNLLNNASKFSERDSHIRVLVEADLSAAAGVLVRVQNTGIGIDAAHLERVFDMYAQVDGSLERPQAGLGLGLSLVKTLVELHGGSVEARSDGAGRGSEFILRLPCLSDGPAVRPVARAAARTPVARRQVLVVDDNRDAADSLATLLELSGHEVRRAYDGLTAVEIATRLRPDLVLLDIGLPLLNGYEAARRIRQTSGRRVKLVAVTGWGQEEARQRSSDSGFDEHLVKPVELATVNMLLEETADRC